MKGVRDLELPNEDRKVISKMTSLLLNETGSACLHREQQAMFQGKDIMRNMVGLNERYYEAVERNKLKAFVCLDCSKGYNMLSWDYHFLSLEWAGLRQDVLSAIVPLLRGGLSILTFAGVLWGISGVAVRAAAGGSFVLFSVHSCRGRSVLVGAGR